MATKKRSYTMICPSLLFLCLFIANGATQEASYDITSSSAVSLVSDAQQMTVIFKDFPESHLRSKRQSAPNPPTNTNADSTTGPSGALPDTNNGGDNSSDPSSNTADATTASPATNPTTTTTTTTTTTESFFKDSDLIHDFHKYYESSIQQHGVTNYWTELREAPKHDTLSNGHRVAAVIKLKFPFYFYGHEVSNVTVATGGFIYMSPFLHQWLTATQYIAPLMANFDPSLSSDSSIFYLSEDNQFIVEWRDVILKDQNSTGKFTFQTVIRKDNTIIFVYKNIPIPVSAISSLNHPVKVGLSDAFYNDTLIPRFNIKRRTIYEYHKVEIDYGAIQTGSVVVLSAQRTCNLLNTCDACTLHADVSFDCRWCNTIGRCSDKLDWYRQHWDKNGCDQDQKIEVSECANLPPPPKPVVNPHSNTIPNDRCVGSNCKKDKDFPVAAIVIIILIICGLFAAFAGWVYYAYTHPTSRSGMWLMEHRPSQIKAKIKFWKNSSDSGAKYKTETDA